MPGWMTARREGFAGERSETRETIRHPRRMARIAVDFLQKPAGDGKIPSEVTSS